MEGSKMKEMEYENAQEWRHTEWLLNNQALVVWRVIDKSWGDEVALLWELGHGFRSANRDSQTAFFSLLDEALYALKLH